MLYDAVIVGGGPAGLAAALTLGRARKRVLLSDAGTPRNAAAVQVHNFVTRDGITPAEFRRIGKQQLERYPNVEVRDQRIEGIGGESGAFEVRLQTGSVKTRRVLLCTGMNDILPEIDGVKELWGKSIFICPYCHAWEIQDLRFGYLARSVDALSFPLLLRGWTNDVSVFTDGAFAIPPEMSERLASANIRVEERRLASLRRTGDRLEQIEFRTGEPLPLDILFVHPRQQQVALVDSLRLKLDKNGFVEVNEMQRETSVSGIYAAGDVVSGMQAAVLAAASGSQAAGMLNHALTIEMATNGDLSELPKTAG